MKRVFSTSKVKKRSRRSYVIYFVSASCQIHLTSIGVGNNVRNFGGLSELVVMKQPLAESEVMT